MNKLNPRQLEAVKYISSPLLVLAGAGSGKTSVITQNLARKREGGNNTRGLTISTFHHLGLTIIRREHKKLGFKSGFSIFDSQDSTSLLKSLLHKEAEISDEQLKFLQSTISN